MAGARGKKGSLLEFTDNEFLVNMDDLQMGPQVGSGHFSTVYIGRYFGDLVAVKKQTRNTKALERYLVRELAALKTLKHPNLVEFIGACNIQDPQGPQSSYAVYMVTEYCEGGDLLSLILSKVPIGWKFRMRVMRDALTGLHYLHGKGLIHRDIKSSNLLLDRQWRCKIADFGMVRDLSNQRMTICGTDEYMATELFLDEDYSTPVDMFSIGIVLLEVIARKKAGENGFAHRQAMSLFALDAQVTRTQLPPDAPPSLVELAIQCCDTEQTNRPDAEAALAWIEDLCNTNSDGEDIPDPALPSTPDFPPSSQSSRSTITSCRTDPARGPSPSVDVNNSSDNPRSPSSANRSTSTTPEPTDGCALDSSINLGFTLSRNAIRSLESTATEMADHPSPYGGVGVYKEGWLHKRNSVGFRTWRRRYVVLKDAELSWYDQPNGEIKGHIDLAGFEQVIRDKRSFRWAVLDPADPSHRTKEFAATSVNSMQRWMTAINAGIGIANKAAVAAQLEAVQSGGLEAGEEGPLPADLPPPSSGQVDLSSFLQSIKLEHLVPTFEERGYNDLQMLVDMGLKDEDLDFLGVEQPLTRRYLKSAFEARCSSADKLDVSLLGHTLFGDVMCYKLRSQWRFFRSVVYLSYEDLKAMQAELKAAANDLSPVPEIPPVPAKHNLKAAATATFFGGRPGEKGKLVPLQNAGGSPDAAYFTTLANLVCVAPERKPLLNIMLNTLELQHRIVAT